MVTCPSCGAENPEGARFCLARCDPDASAELERAREVFATLGAAPLVAEVDDLVRAQRSASAGRGDYSGTADR